MSSVARKANTTQILPMVRPPRRSEKLRVPQQQGNSTTPRLSHSPVLLADAHTHIAVALWTRRAADGSMMARDTHGRRKDMGMWKPSRAGEGTRYILIRDIRCLCRNNSSSSSHREGQSGGTRTGHQSETDEGGSD